MSTTWLLPVGKFFAESLANIFLEQQVVFRLREHLVKKTFSLKVDKALQETISANPDASYLFENFDIQGFLNKTSVIRELSKIVDIDNHREPDIDILIEEWGNHLGSQIDEKSRANY